jgi:hypothetical protein
VTTPFAANNGTLPGLSMRPADMHAVVANRRLRDLVDLHTHQSIIGECGDNKAACGTASLVETGTGTSEATIGHGLPACAQAE